MDIRGRRILLLGGSGLVGTAVARRLLEHEPGALVISALTQAEAEAGVAELRQTMPPGATVELVPTWGDLFVRESLKERSHAELVTDAEARGALLDDLYGELTRDVVARSTLGAMLLRHRPEIVIDSVNTATAFAYQNVFDSAKRLRDAAREGTVSEEAVGRHLATLYLPQLIRHVQITLEALRQVDTRLYIKIGTSGTGGMGLNVPFTHSEERPSRMLLAKAGVAGAHTLLLYLMARTPGAPAVKEIKPTAAISWKRIGYGAVARGGRALPRYDAIGPVALATAFGASASSSYRQVEGTLDGVFLDAGENGLFSLAEFEVLTALGLMEYITPEEVAEDVLREVQGHPTGHDIVAALDAATSGPSYRAGVLRQVALERMEELEAEHGVNAIAYEMLGPPRLSKLLFEAAIVGRLFASVSAAARLDPPDMARRSASLLAQDADLRSRILSAGLAVLLPDGERVLRGAIVKIEPEPGQSPHDRRLPESGWVDLRASNWARWRARLERIDRDAQTLPGPDHGSQTDLEPGRRTQQIRPGRLAAWVFRHEDRGERMKR
ncbi:MAG: short-chain dehydrogenase [Longimicrobiales bacterium]